MKKNKIINIFFVITIVVVLLQGFTFASNNTSSNSSSNSAQKSNTSNTTTKTKAKSSNANLSNLGMNPNDFTGFSENKTSYDVTVPNNVTQVEIYATKKDSKASLTGTGIKKLQEGQNTANVIVTAEDGTTKTYTINIKRLSKNEKQDTTGNLDTKSSSNSKDLKLSNLEIEGVNLEPSFESSTYKYEISIKGEQSNLDIKASTNNTSDKVEIIGNENLQNGQNIITILVTNSKSDEVATYQIYVNKNVIDSNTVDNEFGKTVKELKSDGTEKEYQRKLMPGYVFVKMIMTDDSWYVVRNTRGCTGFVGPEGEPQPLTDEEVRNNALERVSVKVNYEVGDLVNVVDGPLEGFSGTVDEIDVDNNSVKVTVSMFGRENQVEFELDQLEKVEED